MCGIILNNRLIARQSENLQGVRGSEEGCKWDLNYVALLISAESPHSMRYHQSTVSRAAVNPSQSASTRLHCDCHELRHPRSRNENVLLALPENRRCSNCVRYLPSRHVAKRPCGPRQPYGVRSDPIYVVDDRRWCSARRSAGDAPCSCIPEHA